MESDGTIEIRKASGTSNGSRSQDGVVRLELLPGTPRRPTRPTTAPSRTPSAKTVTRWTRMVRRRVGGVSRARKRARSACSGRPTRRAATTSSSAFWSAITAGKIIEVLGDVPGSRREPSSTPRGPQGPGAGKFVRPADWVGLVRPSEVERSASGSRPREISTTSDDMSGGSAAARRCLRSTSAQRRTDEYYAHRGGHRLGTWYRGSMKSNMIIANTPYRRGRVRGCANRRAPRLCR